MRGGRRKGPLLDGFTSSSRRLSDESCFEMFQSDSNGRTREEDGGAAGRDDPMCAAVLVADEEGRTIV